MENQKEINIVFSGGEMRGGYAAGFLKNFAENVFNKGHKFNFYTSSASSPTVLYFLSHGLGAPAEKIWIKELSKESSNLKNTKKYIDIDGIM